MNTIVSIILAAAMAFSAISFMGDSGKSGLSENKSGPHGPAPNSHDGIPDGSGNDAPFGPINGG